MGSHVCSIEERPVMSAGLCTKTLPKINLLLKKAKMRHILCVCFKEILSLRAFSEYDRQTDIDKAETQIISAVLDLVQQLPTVESHIIFLKSMNDRPTRARVRRTCK